EAHEISLHVASFAIKSTFCSACHRNCGTAGRLVMVVFRVFTLESRLLKFSRSLFQEVAVSPDPAHTSRVAGLVQVLPIAA
ncbi:TPA: hypothetical protein DCZ31_01680, partial [Patescibacteria group bacterium]|nr:hypothetical protein [Candidatus Gracilibacteria bacterium]